MEVFFIVPALQQLVYGVKTYNKQFYKLFKTHNYEKTFIRSARSCWYDSMRAE